MFVRNFIRIGLFWKMPSAETMQVFEQRAQITEEKLGFLRQHLSNLQRNFVTSTEKCLQQQNELLQEKVATLKKKLEEAEQANNTGQVTLPSVKEVYAEPPRNPNTLANGASKPTPNANKEKKAKQAKSKDAKPKKTQTPKEEAPVDVSRLDFRVAQIVTVKRHPDADSLYLEEIQTGEENLRTVVTGLVKHVPIEQMENRMVILMCNLKPAKMRGILSQAMVMCANCPEKVEIIDPPPGAVPGERIIFDGYPGAPDAMLNPKKKVWENVQPDLRTNDDCVACYKGVPFTVEGKGVCKVQTLKNCGIK